VTSDDRALSGIDSLSAALEKNNGRKPSAPGGNLRESGEEKIMEQRDGRKRIILIVTAMALVAAVGLRSIEAQSKGKPKPPACVNDGICETAEYKTDLPPGSQPCPDCLASYAPLVIRDTPQIISHGNVYNPYAQRKAFQFVCDGGTLLSDGNKLGQYKEAWESLAVGGYEGRPAVLADADNCGYREIVMLSNDITYESRKTVRKDPRIHLYKTGSAGEPFWTSPGLGEGTSTAYFLTVGDVDNDGTPQDPDNEVIVVRGYGNGSPSAVGIYDLSDGNFNLLKSWTFPDMVYSVEVGDADNDGTNEVVFAAFTFRAPVVKEWNGEEWIDLPADSCDVLGYKTENLFIDWARIRDSDNVVLPDGRKDNELVCGGNNDRLMIWKYDDDVQKFRLKFVSEDLGGFTQSIEVGDFDGDGTKEAVAGSFYGQIYVFQYSSEGYRQVFHGYAGSAYLTGISVGDADGDGIDEICASTTYGAEMNLRILDVVGGYPTGSLNLTWIHPYGSSGIIQ
jgi:FG-GAP-like repeat